LYSVPLLSAHLLFTAAASAALLPLSLHDALPILLHRHHGALVRRRGQGDRDRARPRSLGDQRRARPALLRSPGRARARPGPSGQPRGQGKPGTNETSLEWTCPRPTIVTSSIEPWSLIG